MPKKKAKSHSTLPFESSIASLDKLVKMLENKETSLEDALTAFETGIGLTRGAQTALSAAEQRVCTLTKNSDAISNVNPLPGEEDE